MSATVLFITYTGQLSGAEKLLLEVIGEAQREGREVTVACPDGPVAQALPPGCRHIRIPELSLGGAQGTARAVAAGRLLLRWARTAATVRPLARRPGTDTVVNSVFALPVARLARVPGGVSWLVHDALTSRVQQAVIRFGRPAVRTAVACTRAAAAPVQALDVPVRVVNYGVRWPVPPQPGALHDPPVIGMLSLLTPWKGHRVVLEALAEMPGVTAEFAGGQFPGDHGFVEELRARAAAPDLAGRVHFPGHVDPEQAMARWDVLVSASVAPEAGPLAVLEAMAHGLPVVATAHGGPVEFLRDGVGLLVPPGDSAALAAALRTVLTDGGLRARMAERGRERIATEHDSAVTLPALLRALTS